MTVELQTLRDQNSMSLQSRRKKTAPGKRSETKWSVAPPGVPQQEDLQAHFSGRQNNACDNALSPAKAGLAIHGGEHPGFGSPRSLHPGLYSVPRFAGPFGAAH